MYKGIICSILLLWLLAGCEQQADPALDATPSLTPVVAVVDGKEIRESDIDMEIEQMPESVSRYGDDPKVRAHILQGLIRSQLLSEAARTEGLDLDPRVQQRMARVQRQILIGAARSWRLEHMPKIQDQDIQHYYQQHLDEFTVPEQVHARHIIVGSEKKAYRLLQQLRQHRDRFSSLAATYSLDDSNKARGGDLNWFPRGVMLKPFDDAVFSLKVHGLSHPVKTRFGWHIIEVLGKRAEMQKPLSQVRDEIVAVLQQQWLQQWYQELEKKAHIRIERMEYRQGNSDAG